MRKIAALIGAVVLSVSANVVFGQACINFENFAAVVKLTPQGEGTYTALWKYAAGQPPAAMRGFLTEGKIFLVCKNELFPQAPCPNGEDWVFVFALPTNQAWLYNLSTGTPVWSAEPYTTTPPNDGSCASSADGTYLMIE